MRSFNSLWENVNPDSFYLEENGIKFFKRDIDIKISRLEKNLRSIADWKDKLVFADIKDRMLFMIIFITLQKLGSKVVLVPAEVRIEDYQNGSSLFLTDNKKYKSSIFIDKELKVTPDENFNPEAVAEHSHPDDPEIFLYTSGSTGKAKLIPKSAFNLLSEVEELKKIFNVDGSFVFYFTPPICHIYGLLFDFLLPLYTSAKIILNYNFTPESIASFVANNRIDFFISIPSYYRMFMDLKLIDSFKNCRILTNSSAPLPLDVSKEFFDKNIRITEVYGSTETGGIAYRISAENPEWKVFSYVKIIKDWEDYIERESGDDNIMELKIISPAISVSYDKNSGFNTSDVVKFNEKNNFMLLGRNTRFVKISGKRVDLGYVFEKIKEYIRISENTNLRDEELYIGESGGKIYLLHEREFKKPSRIIKEELKKHLPGYGIPRIIINCKIPRNTMGKINKLKIEEILKNNSNKGIDKKS
jgi:acyl-coenzyme A synthetase/AMP-(fatty) acid ligase